MGQNSKIEWCHHTANLWWGCTKVHEGCDHCYAETLSNRWGQNIWGNDMPRREIKSVWKDLEKYQKLAKAANEIHRVFVGSMMDIFEKPMPLTHTDWYKTDYLRELLFSSIDMGHYDNLLFLFLTKRPSNISKYIPEAWRDNPPQNVMFGTSPCNQKTAETLIRQLVKVNGKRFLSVEPQIDSINIQGFLFHKQIDWVIQGGESGHQKRPFNLDWAYYLKEQCALTDVPYFFKQIDKIQPIPEDLQIREFPKTHTSCNTNVSAAQ